MIVELPDLANVRGTLAHGCFDLLHIGHIRYLKWAASLNKLHPLIVTLTADAHFPKYKGECRPAFPQDIRAECISALRFVDFVAIVDEPSAVMAIDIVRPHIYCKGWEAQGVIPHEVEAVERHGGRVEYMDKECASGQIYSSGAILSGAYLASRKRT